MQDPIAFFITIACYGTWLPGDRRGWVEYHKGWKLPDPIRELEASARMSEEAKRLSHHQQRLVEAQVRETCKHRDWKCHAVQCLSNHVHTVVGTFNTPSKRVRAVLKAWCTRRLKGDAKPEKIENWWAERGSIRWVFNDEELDRVVAYTLDGQ